MSATYLDYMAPALPFPSHFCDEYWPHLPLYFPVYEADEYRLFCPAESAELQAYVEAKEREMDEDGEEDDYTSETESESEFESDTEGDEEDDYTSEFDEFDTSDASDENEDSYTPATLSRVLCLLFGRVPGHSSHSLPSASVEVEYDDGYDTESDYALDSDESDYGVDEVEFY